MADALIHLDGFPAGEWAVKGEDVIGILDYADLPLTGDIIRSAGMESKHISADNRFRGRRMVMGFDGKPVAGYSDDSCDPHWAGGTLADAVSAVEGAPWAEGLEIARSLSGDLGDLDIDLASIRRRMVWGPQGESIDMQRVWSGDLDRAWRHSVRRRTRGSRIIRIAAPVGGNAGTTSEELVWQGVTAGVLADTLESAGYRTEVYAVTPTAHWGSHSMRVYRLKEPNAPLDLGRIVTMCGYTPIFRKFDLPLTTINPVDVGGGLGRSVQPKAEHFDRFSDMLGFDSDSLMILNHVRDEVSARGEIARLIRTVQG